jgi:hypothetical protein
MKLVEQRIELPGQARLVDLSQKEEGGRAHRVDDVLPLGSVSNVHGIVSNEHHMYEPEAELFFGCVCSSSRQTSERTNYE